MSPFVWYGLLLLFVPSTLVVVDAAVETVDLILEPSETEIQFFQYTLNSPGTIDLSGLQFTTDDTAFPIDSNSEDSMVSAILYYPIHSETGSLWGVGVDMYHYCFVAFLFFCQLQSHYLFF
jgi:hypothetical protein